MERPKRSPLQKSIMKSQIIKEANRNPEFRKKLMEQAKEKIEEKK